MSYKLYRVLSSEDHDKGVGVGFRNKEGGQFRHAVEFKWNATPHETAIALQQLIDWIYLHFNEKGERV